MSTTNPQLRHQDVDEYIELTILKVTDPNASSIEEGSGHVAKDSLAAKSNTFQENRGSEPSAGGNPAKSSLSSSTRLEPAADAQSRTAREDSSKEKKQSTYPQGVGGQSKELAVEDTRSSSAGEGTNPNVGTAPSYVSSHFNDKSGPHGKNITEGGFESDDKNNASFNQDIGGENDPGRLAEEKMTKVNAQVGGDAGMPKQKGVTGHTQYDTLENETSA